MITTRLQLASRIQLLLFRELGEKIVIERLLSSELYARDVLLACEALRSEELVELAQRFRKASPQAHRTGRQPQRVDWADDTSGFGYSTPPEEAQPRRIGWFAATRRWLGL